MKYLTQYFKSLTPTGRAAVGIVLLVVVAGLIWAGFGEFLVNLWIMGGG